MPKKKGKGKRTVLMWRKKNDFKGVLAVEKQIQAIMESGGADVGGREAQGNQFGRGIKGKKGGWWAVRLSPILTFSHTGEGGNYRKGRRKAEKPTMGW